MVLYMDLKRWIALEIPKVEDGKHPLHARRLHT